MAINRHFSDFYEKFVVVNLTGPNSGKRFIFWIVLASSPYSALNCQEIKVICP